MRLNGDPIKNFFNNSLFFIDPEGNFGVGAKNTCVAFDNNIISCMSGICKNVSAVYSCTFKSRLDDIISEGTSGYCGCTDCPGSKAYPGECPEQKKQCLQLSPNYPNDTIKKICEDVPCYDCKSICHQRGQCFDMHSRRDPTVIGTDEFGNSVLRYYTCKKGYCSEIYDLKCERRCNERIFDTRDKNTYIFNGEQIIITKCLARSTTHEERLEGKRGEDVLMASCSDVSVQRDDTRPSIVTKDCVNGTWFPNDFNGGSTNYSNLLKELAYRREQEEFREPSIHYEPDITIYNQTK